jgi:hypothetical protein
MGPSTSGILEVLFQKVWLEMFPYGQAGEKRVYNFGKRRL